MEPGFVYISDTELSKIASHLGEKIQDLIARLKLQREDHRWMIDANDGNGCPLLDANKSCSVHPVKPKQCATFPFWPELLDDAAEWDAAKRYCPGIDATQGKIYTRGEILAIRAGWLTT